MVKSHPRDDPYANGSYTIKTICPCLALGCIVGVSGTISAKSVFVPGSLYYPLAIISGVIFIGVGGVISGLLLDPLVNAIAKSISGKKKKDEQKILDILTQNKSSINTTTTTTTTTSPHSYVVPQLNLSGDHVDITITLPYLQQVICPIVSEIQKALFVSNNDPTLQGNTIFIGIVGGSGSGKTTLSQLLVRSFNGLDIPSVTISMDNYHYTNQYLNNTLHSFRKDKETGLPITLKKVKGRSETIDSKSMLIDLKKVAAMNIKAEIQTQTQSPEQQLLLPVYDRTLHDPVPNRLVVSNATRIVIVEGLHLLRDLKSMKESKTSGECWKEINSMFTTLYYLRFDDYEVQKERVMQRRIRGGISREWASPRYDQIDAVVGAEIEQESQRAMEHTWNPKEKVYHNNLDCRLNVMSMCEDKYGMVQLERKDVYDGGSKVVDPQKELSIVESLVSIVGFCGFSYAFVKYHDWKERRWKAQGWT